MDDRRKGLPVRELLDCRLAGIPVTGDLSFYERQSGKVRLDLLYPSWLIFSDGFNLGTGQRVVKRLPTHSTCSRTTETLARHGFPPHLVARVRLAFPCQLGKF